MRIKAATPEGRKHKVRLDNVLVKFAMEADDEAGWVITLATTDDGRPKRDDKGEFVYEKLTGKVEFVKVQE